MRVICTKCQLSGNSALLQNDAEDDSVPVEKCTFVSVCCKAPVVFHPPAQATCEPNADFVWMRIAHVLIGELLYDYPPTGMWVGVQEWLDWADFRQAIGLPILWNP